VTQLLGLPLLPETHLGDPILRSVHKRANSFGF
jgi:hypothetical protein